MDRDQYRRDVRDANFVARRTFPSALLWLFVAVLVFSGIGVAVWYFGVATSGVKGAGDATKITNDGRNRVNAQEWFATQYELIRSTDRRIDEAAAARKAKPGNDIAETNYQGLKNRCMEMVGNYNAEAQKVSRAQWRDPNLPTQIDDSDPKTDCKETAK